MPQEAKPKDAEVSTVKKELWKTVQRPRRQRMGSFPNQVNQNGSRFSCWEVKLRGKVRLKGSEVLGASKDPQPLQANYEFVLKSNLDLYRKTGVCMVDKENLQPGDPNYTGRAMHFSGKVNESRYDRMDVKDESNGMSVDIVYATPVLADERGATSKGVAAVIRDMKRRYRLDVVVILEPRDKWILWELEGLVVDVLVRDDQFLHYRLGFEGNEMIFTVVYTNPNEQRRSRIWSLLHHIASEMEEPWLLDGDFNDIKTSLEQKGGRRINENHSNRFNAWIQDCNLVDIEAKGPFFTWKGPKWDGLDRVYRRLE
ncbi:hypothetical protein K1719_045979 [Acacia pycnantha]|nr:hypothetical protein K1719_045979 [Acacia pycnantha]